MTSEPDVPEGTSNATGSTPERSSTPGQVARAPVNAELQDLEQILQRGMPGLPEQQRQAIIQMVAHASHTYTGPIPPPEMLIAYAKADPTLPGKVIQAWLDESEHRRDMDRKELALQETALTKNTDLLHKGYNHSLYVVMALILCGGFMGYLGHTILAGCIVGTTLLGVLSIYILKQFPKHRSAPEEEAAD